MGDSSDCWRCIHCERLFPSRAARNRHEDTVCEPVDLCLEYASEAIGYGTGIDPEDE